ncbi:MAG: hypothetical protein ACP5OP_07910 [Leptospirillia bacterium]
MSVKRRNRFLPWAKVQHRAWQGIMALVLGGMVMTACSREEGRPIPEQTVLSFVVGKTTETEVLKRLGAPEEKTKLLGEDVWVYRHVKSHGFMSVHTSSKTLRLRFDDRGILQNIDRTNKKANEFF